MAALKIRRRNADSVGSCAANSRRLVMDAHSELEGPVPPI